MKIGDLRVKRYVRQRPGAPPDEVMIVEVETDDGATGKGYVAAGGANAATSLHLLRGALRDAVLGQNPLLNDQIWSRTFAIASQAGSRQLARSCVAGIDFALWDLKGRLLNVPVSDLFGNRRERIPTYANAAHVYPPEEVAETALGYVKQGHKAVKIRCTLGLTDLKDSPLRVRLTREAVGPDVKIMVDVNGSWDTDIALQQLRFWEPYNVYWLEEPVPPDDIAGYVRVRERAGATYIVGGERHVGVGEFRQLIEKRAVDMVQPNAGGNGGITEWLKIYNLAVDHDVTVSPHNLQTVHIHMAAGLPKVKWIEYLLPDNTIGVDSFRNQLLRFPPIQEEVTAEGVFLRPPEKPGLYFELDEALAEQTAVAE